MASSSTSGPSGYEHRSLTIPSRKLVNILGAYGEVLENLKRMSGCKISIKQNKENSKVILYGKTTDNLDIAEELILDAIAEIDDPIIEPRFQRPPRVIGSEEFWMEVPNEMVDRIMGVDDTKLVEIQRVSETYIKIMDLQSSDTSTKRTIYVEGTQEQYNSAKQLINDVISSANVRGSHRRHRRH